MTGQRWTVRRLWMGCAAGLLLVCGLCLILARLPAPQQLRQKRQQPQPQLQASSQRFAGPQQLPRQVNGREFTSSDSCRDCHPEQYASWHRTYHRTMTQVATPETVLAPFEDVELPWRGRQVRLERSGDKFWAWMVDPQWQAQQAARGIDPSRIPNPPYVRKPVVMTTGSHHMQGYWIPSGQGTELLQIPFYYHFDEQRWIPREDVFLRTPERDKQLANWNMTCIKCHSVAGVPGGNPMETAMNSTVAELGIACEACHGPGVDHVRAERAGAEGRSAAGAAPARPIVNPAKSTPKVQSEICGQCHSEFWPADPLAFWTQGVGYRAGADFEESHRVIRFGDPIYRQFEDKYKQTYWKDGTCRVGGDEYNGLIESPCFQRGDLSCLSCHSMHSSEPDDMLAAGMHGDRACVQCHREPRFTENIQAHTHHAAGSVGSRCYNCHMPYTSYALMTALRSHRVTSPQVRKITTRARPNACNLCHLDQTLQWSAGHLTQWYGAAAPELQDDEQRIAASLLWLLRGDAIQRAIAAWHMGWDPAQTASGKQWQAPFLAQVLVDPYAGVRYQAVNSLKRLPQLGDFDADFLGSDADRQSARQDVLDAWSRAAKAAQLAESEKILLAPGGRIQEAAVSQLLNRRDDSYVRIPE